jgi:hypothetical protein
MGETGVLHAAEGVFRASNGFQDGGIGGAVEGGVEPPLDTSRSGETSPPPL